MSDQVRAQIAEKDRSVASTIALINGALDAEVGRSMTLFGSFLPDGWTLDASRTIDIAGVASPTIRAGEHVLNLDFSIPDQFLAHSSAIATVFARRGNDFVHVTTSLKKQDGTPRSARCSTTGPPLHADPRGPQLHGPRAAVRQAARHAVPPDHRRDRARDRRALRRRGRRRADERRHGALAQGSGEISARIASQVSSLGETAASIEQITSTVQRNAEHTQRANTVVSSAAEAAPDGGRAVSRVVETTITSAARRRRLPTSRASSRASHSGPTSSR